MLRGWLGLMWWLARPLAALGVPPDAVTVAGAGLAVGAVRARPGAASTLLVAGAVCDGLDGAVAVHRDTVSAHGRALDHAADRVADLAAGALLVRRGAPAGLVGSALLFTGLLETRRDRRAPVVTVGERPSRVVCAVLGDLACAVTGRRWPAPVAASVWTALAAVAVAQVAAAPRSSRHGSARRRLGAR